MFRIAARVVCANAPKVIVATGARQTVQFTPRIARQCVAFRFASGEVKGDNKAETMEDFTAAQQEAGAEGKQQQNAAPSQPSQDEVIESLRAEVKELKDKVLRCYAEEENVRRIAKRDVDNAREYANTKFATALLEVADYLEYALASVPEDKRTQGDASLKTLYQGVEMTDKHLVKVFQHFGISKYGKIGEKFDPSLHDALFRSPDETKEEGTISQVLKSGYKLKDRVIRAAQVGSYVKPGSS